MSSDPRVAQILGASAALAVTLGFATACQTTTPTPPASTPPVLRSVVGSLQQFRDGSPVSTGFFSNAGAIGFVVARHGQGHGEFLEVASDGKISWTLAPGVYDVVAFRWAYGQHTRVIPIDGQLTVANDVDVTNIGALRADIGSFGVRLGWVEPEGRAAASEAGEGRRGPLTIRRSRVGSFAALLDICHPRWQIQCTREFRGVTPVEPKFEGLLDGPQATRIGSVQPKFSWQSPLADGRTYDLVIWRTVAYKPAWGAWTQYVPAAVEFYAEGLQQPEIGQIPPLRPATRYQWSVRLRDGNTVSSWSTAGHFTFLLVYGSASSGRMFEFETP